MVTAAHTLDNAWWVNPSIEAVPEATGAQMTVLDEMAVEDDENPLAWWMAVVAYEQLIEDAGPLPSYHSLTQDEWDSRHFFGRIVQSWVTVLRT